MGSSYSKSPHLQAAAALAGRAAHATGEALAKVGSAALKAGTEVATSAVTAKVLEAGAKIGATALVVAAGEGYFGGADSDSDKDNVTKELRQYEETQSAKGKEIIIRKIAEAFKELNPKANIDVNGSLDQIISELEAGVPKPGAKDFAESSKKQEDVCRKIAIALNKVFTPGAKKPSDMLIDTSMNAESICRSVGTYVHTLSTGLHEEFLVVKQSVKNALANINVLSEIMHKTFEAIREKAESSDAAIASEYADYADLYKRAEGQLTLQMKALENILQVTLLPREQSLEEAMKDHSEQNAIVQRLGITPGSKDFAGKIEVLLGSMKTAAVIAARVHKALKEAGITVSEYLNSPDFKAFENVVDTKMYQKSNPEDANKFLKAVASLRQYFDRRDDKGFREQLEDMSKTGGAPPETDIEKKVKKLKESQKLLKIEFVKKLDAAYTGLLVALKSIGTQMGSTIPISDKTDLLRDNISRLQYLRESNVEWSIIGLTMGADARLRKEEYLSSLKLIEDICSNIASSPQYSSAAEYFNNIKDSIDKIRKVIDYFSDYVAKQYGETGGIPDNTDNNSQVIPEVARSVLTFNEAINGFLYYYYVAGIKENMRNTASELATFDEKYETVLGEAVAYRLKTVEESYKKKLDLLSEDNFITSYNAAGAAVRPAKTLGKLYDLNNASGGTVGGVDNIGYDYLFGYVPAAAGAAFVPYINQPGDDTVGKKIRNDLKVIKDELMKDLEVKRNFYKVLQAIDIYLKEFTKGIVKDPEAVLDIKRMVEDTEMISRWFNTSSGNCLAAAFDSCNRTIEIAGADSNFDIATPDANNQYNKYLNDLKTCNDDTHHYYDIALGYINKVVTPAGTAQPPAGPRSLHRGLNINYDSVDIDNLNQAQMVSLSNHVGVPIASATEATDLDFRYKSMRDNVSKAIDNFQALKNIINSFARIGSKFNGEDISKKTFMTPSQIYKHLTDYLKRSAINICAPETLDQIVDFPGPYAGCRYYTAYFANSVNPNALHNNFAVENRFFTLMLKAICSKVLVTIGVYDLFEKVKPIAQISSIREVIGGGEESVEIIDAAAELYFRLPRLMEFYYRLFFGENASVSQLEDGSRYRIAFVPTMEGPFTKFIAMFVMKLSPAAVISGEYTSNECKDIIREVNNIYNTFKDDLSPVRSAISGLVKEINKRYGIIKESDYQTMRKMMYTNRGAPEGVSRDSDPTNYAILPGEDDTVPTGRSIAPSDTFASLVNPGKIDDPKFDPIIKLNISADNDNRIGMLNNFRRQLEEFIGVPAVNEWKQSSFSQYIHLTALDIKKESDQQKRFDLVSGLIRSGMASDVNIDKYFMFHETVVTGLSTLNHVNSILDIIDTFLKRSDVINIRNTVFTNLVNLYNRGGAFPADLYALRASLWGDDNTFFLRNSDALLLTLRNQMTALFLGAVPAPLATFTPKAYSRESAKNVPDNFNDIADRIARAFTGYQAIMNYLLKLTFVLQDPKGKLTEVRVSSDGISVDFTGLRGFAQDMMTRVKEYVSQFRPFIDEAVVRRYTGTEDAPGVQTLRSLEQTLVDVRFRGTIVPDGGEINMHQTVEGFSRRFSVLFKELTRDFGTGFIDAAPDAEKTEQYGGVFCNIVYGTGNDTLVINAPGAVPAGDQIVSIGADGIANKSDFLARGIQNKRSILYTFMNLVHNYLLTFKEGDGVSSKIYVNLINSFASGYAGATVQNPNVGFPDNVGGNLDLRFIPKPTAIITNYLANVLQKLLRTTQPRLNIPMYTIATLSEVSIFMKENMRCNLPIYGEWFDAIIQSCKFIKQIIEKTNVNLRYSFVIRGGYAAAVPPTQNPPNIGAGVGTNVTEAIHSIEDRNFNGDVMVRSQLTSLIDGISGGALVLTQTCKEVTKELGGDNSKYFQLYDNFFELYKSQNGMYPLTPASLTTYNLFSGNPLNEDFYPNKISGSNRFKFLYGTKAILRDDFDPKQTYITNVLSNYNQITSGMDRLDEEKYMSFISKLQSYIAFSIRAQYIRNYIFISELNAQVERLPRHGFVNPAAQYLPGQAVVFDIGVGVAVLNVLYTNNWILTRLVRPLAADIDKYTYEIREVGIDSVIRLVEVSDQKDIAKRISNSIAPNPIGNITVDRRRNEIKRSLIEMNINPINIYALTRSVPLATSYIYEYTFIKLLKDMYRQTQKLVKHTTIKFIQLMETPYNDEVIDVTDYADTITRIFLGNNEMSMGRPKFLSDQIFNKVLFGSTYQAVEKYDESGFEFRNSNFKSKYLENLFKLKNLYFTGTPDNAGTNNNGVMFNDANAIIIAQNKCLIMRDLLSDMDTTNAGLNIANINTAINTFISNALVSNNDLYQKITSIWNESRVMFLYARLSPLTKLIWMKSKKSINSGAGNPNIDTNSLFVVDVTDPQGAVTAQMRAKLRSASINRFNTSLIRNVFLICNLQRVMRAKLNRELTQSRSVIVKSHAMVNPSVTEYGEDPFDPNEMFATETLTGEQPFSDKEDRLY